MKIFNLPDLGEGLAEAEIVAWKIKEGDEITADQPMVEVENAKAVMEIPAPFTGKVTKLFGKVGDMIQTGKPLIGFEEGDQEDAGTVVGSMPTGQVVIQESATGLIQTQTSANNIKASPAARALAKKLNIDLANVTATGPGGVITPQDVESAGSTPKSTHKMPEGGEALRGVRRFMAKNMMEANLQVAPATLTEDVDIHGWAEGNNPTMRLMRAMIAACKKVPALNAWYDAEHLTRHLHSHVDLGVAVDTPDGLFVPVLKKADTRTLDTLRQELSQLIESTKSREIDAELFKGATITLSNIGTIGGKYATPIVVPPTVAILAVGKSRLQAMVSASGAIEAHKVMPLSLTFDHRVVTGGEAARFLVAVAEDLQSNN